MADGMASKNKKRRLADMDADEFMQHGFDSDLSEDEEMTTSQSKKDRLKKKNSKTSTHKNQLSTLQEKDPEFYKFLKENDQELLQFNDSDTDEEIEEESSDDEKDEKGDVNEKDNDNETTSKVNNKDNDKSLTEHETDEHEEQDEKQGRLVTMEMVKQWRKELEKMSLHGLRQVLKAFRAAVYGVLDDGSDEKGPKHFTYRVEGNSVFNTLVQLCVKHVYVILHHHIGGSASKHGKITLPSSNKNWSQVKTHLKFYLNDLLQLLRTLAEPSMLCVILKHAQQLSPYFACYPKITKKYIKRLIRMWATGNEHVRVMAFLAISKLLSLLPSVLLEFTVKQLYMSFVKNTKFTSPKTRPLITFMQNSLVEVFRTDPNMTYQHAFVYIRQLAIHLRNAIVNKKKDSYQSVYNWQYVHCIHLWCRVLSEVPSQGILDPLIYPLVQVTLGVIKLLPTARYYPLRFHCIRSLNQLSKATDTYIPIAPFLLEILQSEFNKKIKMSTAKPLDFSCVLKVSKSALHTKPFEDAVVDSIFETSLEYFSIHSHSIAFPEIILPSVIMLRKFIKTTPVPKYRKQMKQLLEKIEETSKEVTERRSSVTFSPKDIKQVESWTAQHKQQPNAIVKFYTTWKLIKPAIQSTQGEEMENEESDSEDEQPKQKRQKKTKKNTQKDDKKYKNQKQNGVKTSDGAEKDDIVEDFQFSSDEED